MKFWLIAPWLNGEELIELAPIAEELGFEGIMGADHGFIPKTMSPNYPYSEDGVPPIDGRRPYPEVWTSIAAMAMVTKTLKFNCGVYVLPLRHPIEVAKAAANIARISANRLVIGAGAGWMREEFDVYGVPFERRGKRMDEMIDVLRTLWQGGYVEHHGEFYDFPSLQINPVPERPVPIYIGGANKRALERAATLGDGWIGTGNSVEETERILGELNRLRSDCGRSDVPFEVIGTLRQLDLDVIKSLEEKGMTSLAFGFGDNYTMPIHDKRGVLEWFANNYMQQLG